MAVCHRVKSAGRCEHPVTCTSCSCVSTQQSTDKVVKIMTRPRLTVNAAVLVASVEEVVLQHIQQASHLTEDQNPGPSGLQAGQQLVQQHKLACKCQTRRCISYYTKI